MLALFSACAGKQVVEDVEITFARGCPSDTISLEIVIECFHTCQSTPVGELQFGVFAKSRRIGIEQRSCISEGLENEFGAGNLGGKFSSFLSRIAHAELYDAFNCQPSAL